jgi:hypothetical protein
MLEIVLEGMMGIKELMEVMQRLRKADNSS